MEVIYLQFEVSKKQGDEYTSYWDFQGIQERLKKLFSGLAFIIWGYYFLDNFSIFDFLLEQAKLFLTKPWNPFGGTFTFGSVAIFFLVAPCYYFGKQHCLFCIDQRSAKSKSEGQKAGFFHTSDPVGRPVSGFVDRQRCFWNPHR